VFNAKGIVRLPRNHSIYPTANEIRRQKTQQHLERWEMGNLQPNITSRRQSYHNCTDE